MSMANIKQKISLAKGLKLGLNQLFHNEDIAYSDEYLLMHIDKNMNEFIRIRYHYFLSHRVHKTNVT